MTAPWFVPREGGYRGRREPDKVYPEHPKPPTVAPSNVKSIDWLAQVLADHTITESTSGGAECECGNWSGSWSGNAPETHRADEIRRAERQ